MPADKMRPNSEAVAKLVRTPREKQAEQRFDGQGYDGLVLLMQPSGSASWWAYYRLKGRPQVKLKLGNYGDMSLESAKLANNRVRVSIGEGVDPKAAMKAGETFMAVAERALTDNHKWWETTKRNYGYTLRKDVFPVIGNLPINTVTKDDCFRVVNKVKARGKLRSADNARRIMRDTFKWAVGENYTDKNPAAELPVIAKPTERTRAPSPEELRAIWRALDSPRVSDQMRLVIRLIVFTGMRRGEVAGVRCDERDADKLVIAAAVEKAGRRIVKGRMKNDRKQTIYLSRQAVALLDEAMEKCSDGTYFFPGDPTRTKGKLKTPHVNPAAITTRMNAISRALGIELVGIHDIRRVITDWMEDEGLSASTQDAILHHTPQDTRSKHYLDRDGERRERQTKMEARLREAWQTWADHVEKIVSAS